MAKHRAPDHRGSDAPAEVTLARAAEALEGLGFEPLQRPDRLVGSAYAYIATVWESFDAPLSLVVDCSQRIPVEFERAGELAAFLNTWNHDRIGPVASAHLMDTGDFEVHLRASVRTKHGLNDDQLASELADCMEYCAAFSVELRSRLVPPEWDHPLPPPLSRAQDAEALLGRHPSERHLPRGGEAEVFEAPDSFAGPSGDQRDIVRAVELARLEEAFDLLDFSYGLTPQDVIATGVNGVPFAACLDGDAGHRYARVTAMWDADVPADRGFMPLWLMCNDFNEQAVGVRTYLHEFAGDLHLHAESTVLASAGLSDDQLNAFVVTSLVSILGAVDAISTECDGTSVVNWPSSSS